MCSLTKALFMGFFLYRTAGLLRIEIYNRRLHSRQRYTHGPPYLSYQRRVVGVKLLSLIAVDIILA